MGKLKNHARQIRLDYQQKLGRAVSISEVAQAIGMTRAALSNIEANKSQPSHAAIERLCKFYGIQPGDLLEYIGDWATRYAAGCQPITA